MSDAAIFYASTSGRTGAIVDVLKKELEPATVDVFNLRDCDLSDLQRATLLIFGSPTYGKGELHHLWQDWRDRLLAGEVALGGKEVAAFALGDSKHHRKTFAGALGQFQSMCRLLGTRLLGSTLPHDADEREACRPLLSVDGTLSGLVIDKTAKRQLTATRISNWAGQVMNESNALRIGSPTPVFMGYRTAGS